MATPGRPSPGQVAGGALAALLLLIGGVIAANQPPSTSSSSTTTTRSTSTSTSSSSTTTTRSTSTSTSSSSTTSTTAVAPTAGVRPLFSPAASINQPVATFGASKDLQEYSTRLWNYGGGAAPKGRINVGFGDYSVPFYDAKDATTIARGYQATWAQNLMSFGTLPIGGAIPWNPTWKGGTGNDGYLIIVDRVTDQVWELGGVGGPAANCAFNLANASAGFDPGASRHLCLSRVQKYSGLYTADPSIVDGRGMGGAKAALLALADEVAAGIIPHALQLTIVPTMFGPPCRPVNNASAVGAGSSCGFYVPPATKLERNNPDIGCPVKQAVTIEERRKTIPEGLRFALAVTDADIEQWLDSRAYTGPLRSTARVFAVALRDYGFIVSETGCFGMLIGTDSATVGPSAPKWRALGITGAAPNPNIDLLAGLITPERIVVVEPPS